MDDNKETKLIYTRAIRAPGGFPVGSYTNWADVMKTKKRERERDVERCCGPVELAGWPAVVVLGGFYTNKQKTKKERT